MTEPAADLIKTYIAVIEQALKTGQAGEHTHRPALESLLEALGGDGVDAINEPRQIACGAPDFIVVRGRVPLGHVEAKDVGVDLAKTERSEQLTRYRESLANLVLTSLPSPAGQVSPLPAIAFDSSLHRDPEI